MTKKILILLLLSIGIMDNANAQYSINGQLTNDFENKAAYLDIIDSWNGFNTISAEMVLQKSVVDSLGNYHFSGNELTGKLGFYRIRIIDKKEFPISIGTGIAINFTMTNNDIISIRDEYQINDVHKNKLIFEISKKVDSFNVLIRTSNFRIQKLVKDKKENFLTDKVKNADDPLVSMLSLNYKEVRDEQFIELASVLANRLDRPDYRSDYKISLERYLGQENYTQLLKKNRTQTWILFISFLLNFITVVFILVKYFRRKTKSYKFEWNILTNKELEILEHISHRKSNKEMAEALFISEATIKSHVNNIYRKAGIKSRKEAIKLYNTRNST